MIGYRTVCSVGIGVDILRACGTPRFGDDPAPTISVSGFVAWNTDNKAFCWPEGIVPVTGNYYGNSGTVSSQAETLGWSTDIWDLSGELPRLK